ncbi:MAG: DNA-binding MarR family transcriptional regulator [Flavobacteriales bacterium]|jgi:DNA-binding MarR family transcriptional regulator
MSQHGGPFMQFFREIFILEQLSRNRMERVLPGSMKVSHFGVLNHLKGAQGQRSPAELAENFQVTRPTMTNTLQKLDKAKFVNIVADPDDGRGKMVSISEAGEQALLEAIAALASDFKDIAAGLGVESFVDAIPRVAKIREYMDVHR